MYVKKYVGLIPDKEGRNNAKSKRGIG